MIPLLEEARYRWRRNGLDSIRIASDLNPVAVLINKALIEIPAKLRRKSPVNSQLEGKPIC